MATPKTTAPTPADLLRYIDEHGLERALDSFGLQGEATGVRSAVAGIRRHEAEAVRLMSLAAAQKRQSEIHHITLANLLSRVG
jgi:hypothetical protein